MVNISSDVIRGYNDTIILYLLLDTRLEKNGYISSFSSNDNASGKRRTYYQITDAGREYYRLKCEEWKLTLDVVSKFIRF